MRIVAQDVRNERFFANSRRLEKVDAEGEEHGVDRPIGGGDEIEESANDHGVLLIAELFVGNDPLLRAPFVRASR